MTRHLPFYPHNLHTAPDEPGPSGLRVLKPASMNRKLGGNDGRVTRRARRVFGRKLLRHVVRVGPFAGFPLYALTIPERTTCPITCQQWRTCYGKRMPFAKRYNPGPELERATASDVATLARKYTTGYAVRLHVLGDFYSVAYVEHWRHLLARFRALHIFGYTHRVHGSRIGNAVAKLAGLYPVRFAVLRSDPVPGDGDPLPRAHTLPRGQTEPVAGSVVCPAQTGRTAGCLTCGLCMDGRTSVSFILH